MQLFSNLHVRRAVLGHDSESLMLSGRSETSESAFSGSNG